MTVATQAATRDDSAKITALEAEARALAGTQLDLQRAESSVTHFLDLSQSPVARALERARKYLASTHFDDPSRQKAAEWFLDNYYLIRRVARQVTQDLPPSFFRRLPQLASGPARGVPRIDALARALVVRSSIEIDVTALQAFVHAYQEVSPLTIAEVWALPTMLRDSVLHGLLLFLEELGVPVHGLLDGAPSHRVPPDAGPLGLGPAVGVERSIRGLRLLAEIDWKTFFEKTNRVEAILRRDPAHVYGRMDFDTCDSYRKTVENLAWATGAAEEDVAELAVEFARQKAPDPRCGHVGYYLVDGGRRELEDRLGYRPRGLERVRRAITRSPDARVLLGSGAARRACLCSPSRGASRAAARAPRRSRPASCSPSFRRRSWAVTIVQWTLTRLLPTRALPKLDFAKGLPDDIRTLVVIPTLLGRSRGRRRDAPADRAPLPVEPRPQAGVRAPHGRRRLQGHARGRPAARERRARGIEALNATYGEGPVRPVSPPAPRAALEPRRGALHGLGAQAREARGAESPAPGRHGHELHAPRRRIRQGSSGSASSSRVDSDTQLPMGTARRLVGVARAPAQPRRVRRGDRARGLGLHDRPAARSRLSPSSSRQTLFARIFAGDIGFDIYTHAVSESYQDLFGVRDLRRQGHLRRRRVHAQRRGSRPRERPREPRSLRGHPRARGARHRHRPLRGLSVSLRGVTRGACTGGCAATGSCSPGSSRGCPRPSGEPIQNQLAAIDRWKIFDNLRRSLTSPLHLRAARAGIRRGCRARPSPGRSARSPSSSCRPSPPSCAIDGGDG